MMLIHLCCGLLLFHFVSCQKFEEMREVSITNESVTLAVEVDPQSSTFAFNWFARVNGTSKNTNLALVGLDGNGNVGVILESSALCGNYSISNEPKNLTTITSPWNTSLTFDFFDEVTTYRFLVSTVTSEKLSPRKYSALTAGNNTNGGDWNKKC